MPALPSSRRRQRTVSSCVGILPGFFSMSTRKGGVPLTDEIMAQSAGAHWALHVVGEKRHNARQRCQSHPKIL